MRARFLYFVIFLGTVLLIGCQYSKKQIAELPEGCYFDNFYEVTKGELSMSLEIEDAPYKGNVVIPAKIELKNNSETSLLINGRLLLNTPKPEKFGEVYFVIFHPSGSQSDLLLMYHVDYPKDEDFVTLEPGALIEKEYDLWSYEIIETGLYCVQAIYHNQSDPSNDLVAWKGYVYSNIAEFHYER